MPKYVIDREIPNVADVKRNRLSRSLRSPVVYSAILKQASVGSQLRKAGQDLLHLAPNEKMVREHARQGRISRESSL
jgi:hypothetical protein